MISKIIPITKYSAIIILFLIAGYNYMNIKRDLADYEVKKVELTTIKEQLDELQIRYELVNKNYKSLTEASFELEKVNQAYEETIRKRDFEKLEEKKPRMVEKVYTKAINEYYNTFFDCGLCNDDESNPSNTP